MIRAVLLALPLLALLLGAPLAAGTRAGTEAQFRHWLDTQVWPLARSQGVSRATWDAALGRVTLDWTLPGVDLPGVVHRAQKQSEFAAPGAYFRPRTLQDLARTGRDMAARHAAALSRAERATGVPGRIVLAIWGRESGFGKVAGRDDAYQVLATRGFFGPSGDYFTGELVAALTIAQSRGAARPLMSSWAGAMGQPQFMPSSYLAYAADGDGNGTADIWGSDADAIASIARFLAAHGWTKGRDWGYEVSVPARLSCALEGPDRPRTIAAWESLGITRVNGRSFPADERPREATLLMPAGRLGPAFLVTPNFYVIKDYNNSDLYGLFIGNAADRIAYGMADFRAPWRKTDPLLRSDISAIQAALIARGYDPGGTDGLPGFKTRRSIGEWQAKTGRAPTCYPDAKMKAALGG